MKKIISFLMCVLIISTIAVSAFAVDTVALGDANCDGKINMLDITAIMKYCAGWDLGDGINADAADTNRDGKVSIADSAYLMKWLAGWYEIEYL